MSKKHNQLPSRLPLQFPLSEKINSGKDNRVYGVALSPDVATRIGHKVLKASNPPEKGKVQSTEQLIGDARFKEEKYNLLRTFLGDYVPKSSFFIGSQRDPDGSIVKKSYTVQDRVPNINFDGLSPSERRSDELLGQMYGLVCGIQNMHKALRRARDVVEASGDEFLVDATLDLGPISGFVRERLDEDPATFNYKYMATGYKASPNLLVDADPEGMKLYCVDFGRGEWSEKLGSQLALVYDIAAHDPEIHANLPQPINA
jgi:hypothetical protein